MKKRIVFQIIYAILVLVLLYYLSVSLEIIGIFALLILAILLFKGPLYKKIEKIFTDIKFFSKLSPRMKKILVVIIFLLFFMIFKQILFFVLNLFGIDIQTALTESINNSLAQ